MYIYDAMPKCQSIVPRSQPVGGLTTPTATAIIQLQHPPATQSPIYLVNNTKTWQDFWMGRRVVGRCSTQPKVTAVRFGTAGIQRFRKRCIQLTANVVHVCTGIPPAFGKSLWYHWDQCHDTTLSWSKFRRPYVDSMA